MQRAHHQAILQLNSAELSVSSPAAKSQWRRGIVSTDPASGERLVQLLGSEQSHLVFALAQANALVNIPEGTAEAHHGDTLTVMMLEEG
jgi:molybdopterin molybdotransferase